MNKEENKTHWLQSPNKNYLGHWDLPSNDVLILTIKTAKWEEVTNPITRVSASKRVIRFVEDVKPFICNQTNAQLILTSTKEKIMEYSGGKKIKLKLSQTKVAGEMVDCIRVDANYNTNQKNDPVSLYKQLLSKQKITEHDLEIMIDEFESADYANRKKLYRNAMV